jgi:hypothetical protein
MTFDETAAILGPEITARLDTAAATWPPLTPAQIAEIAPLLVNHDPAAPATLGRQRAAS